jgi:hypothetical protein
MSILSWLKSKKQFMSRSAIDEFREFTRKEADQLRTSDNKFDEAQYQQAVNLVVRKLQRKHRVV